MKRLVLVIAILTLATNLGYGQVTVPSPSADPISFGQPLSFWLKALRERDLDEEMAFDAIVHLGPAAWKAVPELTKILAEPFTPIRLGSDTRTEIHAKLLEIDLRGGAVDSLGAIGLASAPAAEDAIRWGLTRRMIPPDNISARDRLYIQLVGIDVLERMRVAGAVARFGPGASAAVQNLIESPDIEKQKFAAAILNDSTITIAHDLMKSDDCKNRVLGLSLLSAMWPVVAREHLVHLKEVISCPAPGSESREPVIETTSGVMSGLD